MRRLAAIGLVLAVVGCSKPVPKNGDEATGPQPRRTPKLVPGPSDPDAPEEFTQTASGLKYRVLRKGSGDTPARRDTVLAHYRGWLDDGFEFDSSYKRGEPTEFPLTRVIPAWTEGLQHVREGGMIELEVPPGLGYGQDGSPPDIPPNATLHFVVELKDVR